MPDVWNGTTRDNIVNCTIPAKIIWPVNFNPRRNVDERQKRDRMASKRELNRANETGWSQHERRGNDEVQKRVIWGAPG